MSRGVLKGRSARNARRGSTFLEIVGNCDRIANITLFCVNNVKLMTMSLVWGGGRGDRGHHNPGVGGNSQDQLAIMSQHHGQQPFIPA